MISLMELSSKTMSGFKINAKSLFTFLIPKLLSIPILIYFLDKIHLTSEDVFYLKKI